MQRLSNLLRYQVKTGAVQFHEIKRSYAWYIRAFTLEFFLQDLKESGSQTLTALESLSTNARLCITATPIQNNLAEFFHVANFVSCRNPLFGALLPAGWLQYE